MSSKDNNCNFTGLACFYPTRVCAILKIMKNYRICTIFCVLFLGLQVSCESGEEAFVDDRLLMPCQEAYYICNRPAGCVIDKDHYVEGVFPGTRRMVVRTERRDVRLDVKLYISFMEAPGTEIFVQAWEPDCTLDTINARDHRVDVDIFEEAGDDRTLGFSLNVAEKGEHLLDINSDASAEYLLLVAQK
jgi:hypothetical protein